MIVTKSIETVNTVCSTLTVGRLGVWTPPMNSLLSIHFPMNIKNSSYLQVWGTTAEYANGGHPL